MLNKKPAIALTLMIVLTIPMMFAISQTNAQTQLQIDNFLYVYASPNPVGVGQTEYLSARCICSCLYRGFNVVLRKVCEIRCWLRRNFF